MCHNQSYFSSQDTPANATFLANYRARFGADKYVNSIGEATYIAAKLYAAAVTKAASTETETVINAMAGLSFSAPQGDVRFNGTNNHLATHSILGKCRSDGLFDIIEDFGQIEPVVAGCTLG